MWQLIHYRSVGDDDEQVSDVVGTFRTEQEGWDFLHAQWPSDTYEIRDEDWEVSEVTLGIQNHLLDLYVRRKRTPEQLAARERAKARDYNFSRDWSEALRSTDTPFLRLTSHDRPRLFGFRDGRGIEWRQADTKETKE